MIKKISRNVFVSVVFLISFLAAMQALLAFSEWKELNDRPLGSRLPVSPSDNYQSKYDLTAHKLAVLEYESGLIRLEELELALAIIDTTLDDFKDTKIPDEPSMHDMIKLFQSIGYYIGERYIYKSGTTFVNGLIKGEIDCDLRSFLYLSIAEKLNIQGVGVVYAPGHAFIGWENSERKGFPILWETTSEKGQIAQFTDSLYSRVSSYEHDYKIMFSSSIIDLHKASIAGQFASQGNRNKAMIILNELKEESIERPFYNALLAQIGNNPFYAEKYLKHTYDSGSLKVIADSHFSEGRLKKATDLYDEIVSYEYDLDLTERLGSLHQNRLRGFYIEYLYGPVARSMERLYGSYITKSEIAELTLPILFITLLFVFIRLFLGLVSTKRSIEVKGK